MLRTGAPLLLLLLSFTLAAAQPVDHPLLASRADARTSARSAFSIPDTVRVLALMVQFREDADARTSGNGRFDLRTLTDPIIDPPPRDAAYFRRHLAFLEFYFRKSSGGLTIILPTLVDQVVTLPQSMADFSPPRGASNRPVGDLAVASWRAADSLGLVSDFSQYESFLVFHAGVGRDIDLIALLGYDPTPLDIPSLYLGPAAFREFYGGDFTGIPVNGGAFRITNTIILPETETRTLPGVTGDVTLELGINGLLCASMGNHLGLPDLFDTRTGRSAIGRFGLMDGQGIFSFFGLFPPEPSAWEKYWLGWVTPVTLDAGVHAARLPAAASPDTVYRVPVSAQEYYLIENRNRDPQRNGQTITAVVAGQTVTRTILRDTAGFSASDISALEGTILEVEDLDWSLPGGVSRSGEFFDGGVLIWHIDEAAIADGLRGAGVNSNPRRRGVRLLEADGSQDIGQQYEFLSPGSGSEDGTALDFWYEGNSAPLYRNRFDGTTMPAALTNSGAKTHVALRNFGPRGPVMTAEILVGDSLIQPLPGFPFRLPGRLADAALTVERLQGSGRPSLLISTEGGVYGREPSGAPAMPGGRGDGLLLRAAGRAPTGVTTADLDGDGVSELLVADQTLPGRQGGALRVHTTRDLDGDSLADHLFTYQHANLLTSVPVAGEELIVTGADAGAALILTRTGQPLDSSRVNTESPAAATVGVAALTAPRTFCFVSGTGVISVVSYAQGGAQVIAERHLGAAPAGPPVTGRFGGAWGTAVRIVAATVDGRLHALDSLLSPLPGYPVVLRGAPTGPPALADVNADGARDIIVTTPRSIEAFNVAGAALDHFPVMAASSQSITAPPVAGDAAGDGRVAVLTATADGLVLGYDGRGREVPGFPLQAGTGGQSIALWPVPGDLFLGTEVHVAVASSDTSAISAWRTGVTAGPVPAGRPEPWPQYQGNAQRSGLAEGVPSGSAVASSFFPAERAYNWPNPVYDGRTYLRYFVATDASVTITIYDLAGDRVAEFPGPGIGGVDNEAAWDVGGVQSGVYFARIEASGSGGNGVAVVKVAVVK